MFCFSALRFFRLFSFSAGLVVGCPNFTHQKLVLRFGFSAGVVGFPHVSPAILRSFASLSGDLKTELVSARLQEPGEGAGEALGLRSGKRGRKKQKKSCAGMEGSTAWEPGNAVPGAFLGASFLVVFRGWVSEFHPLKVRHV